MSPELEAQIVARWPDWFDVHGDPRHTGMTAGFRCGDGWYVLVYRLCERLEPLVNELNHSVVPNESFEVVQVKEKFGGLRFYVNRINDAIAAEIDLAQLHSFSTCEACGRAGMLRRSQRFILTLCDECLATAPPRLLPDPMAEEKTVVSHFEFRLNGIIIPHMIVRPIVSDGGTHRWELVACDEKVGTFAIRDNDDLDGAALPAFVLEVKDLSVHDSGWEQMTTQECIALLEVAGIIDTL